MSSLPNGVYRISKWGASEQPQVLTLTEDGQVTILPPGEAPEGAQKWRVENVNHGLVAIQIPVLIWPSRSLSFEGEPEEGKKIIVGPPSDFPTREWRIEVAPQKPLPVPYFIRVPDKDLMVSLGRHPIFPPQLALEPATNSLQNAWAFELLDRQ